MSKTKSAFFCQNCGYESAKWLGKCPSCTQWNTFVEELIEKRNLLRSIIIGNRTRVSVHKKTIALHQINSSEETRLITSDAELNRVLGGGIVPGSIVLVAVNQELVNLLCFTKRFADQRHIGVIRKWRRE
jgi:DNA repair protein RadA/Sms